MRNSTPFNFVVMRGPPETDWTEEISPPAHLRLNGMTASRDGRLLATLGENDIRILETTGFTERLRLTPPAHVGWLGECHLVFDAMPRTCWFTPP
jgi:hypothetical protein